MKKTFVCTLSLLALCFAATTRAAVIVDYSPATINVPMSSVYNQHNGQHFYEAVSFPQGAVVDGMAMYVLSNRTVGLPIAIDVYSNNAGDLPGHSVYNFVTALTAVDSQDAGSTGTVRAYAPIPTPINMAPGERLWFSMAGFQLNLGGYIYSEPDGIDGSAYLFNVNNQPAGLTTGNMSMQLYGTLIPEPTTLTLLAATMMLLRRRR